MKSVDVVIIGGSLAGATCVRELTRLGIGAVAFERDPFPREKVCGGFVSPGAVELLEELGMKERVCTAGAKPVNAAHVRMWEREAVVELRRRGLGISRKVLDALMADCPGVVHGAVRNVLREGKSFRLHVDGGEISARVVIDAAGKLSRFTPRRTSPQFGVQFYEAKPREGILDFWFFDGGYGGSVGVEGGRSNACFLINKDAVRTLDMPQEALITGPIAFDRIPSDFLAIGDAAGMVDPFCGEGMRHALDTGIQAARFTADGLARSDDYDRIRNDYQRATARRWRHKRRLGRLIRTMLAYPKIVTAGFRTYPEFWFRKLWD